MWQPLLQKRSCLQLFLPLQIAILLKWSRFSLWSCKGIPSTLLAADVIFHSSKSRTMWTHPINHTHLLVVQRRSFPINLTVLGSLMPCALGHLERLRVLLHVDTTMKGSLSNGYCHWCARNLHRLERARSTIERIRQRLQRFQSRRLLQGDWFQLFLAKLDNTQTHVPQLLASRPSSSFTSAK